MATLTLVTGILLAVLGVVFHIASGAESLTALIPTLLGALLIIAGLLARRDSLRRHAIHAALAVALLGVLGSLMNVVRIGELFAGSSDRPLAILESALMFVVLVVYLVVGVRSFLSARRWRREHA